MLDSVEIMGRGNFFQGERRDLLQMGPFVSSKSLEAGLPS